MNKVKLPLITAKAYDEINLRPLGKKAWYYTCLLLGFYLVIHWASYNNVAPFCYLLFAVGIILTFVRMSWGFYYYIVVSMLSDDTLEISSVHLIPIGPFTIIIHWTMFMFFMLIFCYLKGPKPFKANKLDKSMFGVIGIFLIAGVIGVANLSQFPRVYISDASYMVNMAIAYFFIRIWMRREEQLRTLVSLIIISYGVKAVVGVVFYYIGTGFPAGRNLRVIYESGRVILGPVFFLCLGLLFYLPKMKLKHRILLSLFAFATLFHLISFGSRGLMILTTLGVLLFAVFSWKNGYRFLIIKYVAVTILSAILCLAIMDEMRPGAISNIRWKLSTLGEYDLSETQVHASLSVTSRIIQAINIFYTQLDNHSLFWGAGLGGWFTDEHYPFGNEFILMRIFPMEQFASRIYTKPHGTPLVIFLKMGIGGLFAYYFIMLLFFKSGYVISLSTDNEFWKASALAICVAMPFLFYGNYMSKLQFFFGVILGILANIESLRMESARVWQSKPSRKTRIIYNNIPYRVWGI